MSRKKKSEDLAPFREIIQVPLMPEMVDDVERLILTKDDVRRRFDDLPEYGLITTVSPDPKGGFTTSVRMAIASNGNAGLMYYSKGPTTVAAKAVALVKLDFLERLGDWSLVSTESTSPNYR